MVMASSVLSSVASLIVGGGAGGGVDTTALLRVQDTSHLLPRLCYTLQTTLHQHPTHTCTVTRNVKVSLWSNIKYFLMSHLRFQHRYREVPSA